METSTLRKSVFYIFKLETVSTVQLGSVMLRKEEGLPEIQHELKDSLNNISELQFQNKNIKSGSRMLHGAEMPVYM